jgi:Tfp pilus assembly protein PilO
MREIISLLRQKERKLVGALSLLTAVALLFYIFFARGVKDGYARTQNELQRVQSSFQTADSARNENKVSWEMWQQTYTDLEQLRSEYFYSKESIAQDLRQDIEDIFRDIGIPTPDIRYSYQDSAQEKIAKVTAAFQVSGPYYLMKKFAHAVEKYPKFLIMEKIDFSDINMQSGGLKLKITLAGYYED